MTEQKWQCPKCGSELAYSEARFCTLCGTSIGDGEAIPRKETAQLGAQRKTKSGRMGRLALDPVEPPNPAQAEAEAAPEVLTIDEWDVTVLESDPPPAARAEGDVASAAAPAATTTPSVDSVLTKKEPAEAMPVASLPAAALSPSEHRDATSHQDPLAPRASEHKPPTGSAGEVLPGDFFAPRPRSPLSTPPLSRPGNASTPPDSLAPRATTTSSNPGAISPIASSAPPASEPGASGSSISTEVTARVTPPAPLIQTAGSFGDKNITSPAPLIPAEMPLEERVTVTPGADRARSAPAPAKDDRMANIIPPVQEKRTIVEEGTKLKGSLESSCPVVVHGRVEGEVQAPSLTVSATGVVEGAARVGTIKSEGELAGEFDAEHVELSGNVKDNTVIRATTIELKLAGKRGKKQIIFGESENADQQNLPYAAGQPEVPRNGKSQPPARGRSEPPRARPSQPPPPAE